MLKKLAMTTAAALAALALTACAPVEDKDDAQGDGAPAGSQSATKSAAAKDPAPATYAGAKKGDKLAVGGKVELSGWTATAGPLKPGDATLAKTICTAVTLFNRDDEQQEYSQLSWKLQSPSGVVDDATFTGSDNMLEGSAGVAPGGTAQGDVCFNWKPAPGTWILSWQPDVFSSEDRGVWLNKL